MIPKPLFVEKLRSLGYKFHAQKDRVDLWKRAGDLRYALVHRRDLIPIAEIRSTLKQAGMSGAEIEAWIASCNPPNP